MKRPLLWIVALVIAAAPVLVDVCAADCGRERPPECPLHRQAPHGCQHNRTIGKAGVVGVSQTVSRPLDTGVAVAAYCARGDRAGVAVSRIDRQHAPPLRSPRPDVLRI